MTSDVEKTNINILKNIQEIHKQTTDCIKDPYYIGMYNGMELCISVLSGSEPKYLDLVEGEEKKLPCGDTL